MRCQICSGSVIAPPPTMMTAIAGQFYRPSWAAAYLRKRGSPLLVQCCWCLCEVPLRVCLTADRVWPVGGTPPVYTSRHQPSDEIFSAAQLWRGHCPQSAGYVISNDRTAWQMAYIQAQSPSCFAWSFFFPHCTTVDSCCATYCILGNGDCLHVSRAYVFGADNNDTAVSLYTPTIRFGKLQAEAATR